MDDRVRLPVRRTSLPRPLEFLGQTGLYVVGFCLALANAVRHRIRVYRTPRTFSSADVDRAVAYDVKVADRWASRGALDVTDKAVLEIGPGPDRGTGAILLARGAASYCAVDAFPLVNDDSRVLDAIERAHGPVDRNSLGYVIDEFPALLGVDGQFDLIVSNATLEHVADVAALFSRCRELLRPGGQMCHHIDAKTHMRWFCEHDPFNIYRYSDRVYRMMWFEGVPNRLLAGDYVAAAAQAGFEAEVVPNRMAGDRYVRRTRPHLAEAFRVRKDLGILTFTLNCRLKVAAS